MTVKQSYILNTALSLFHQEGFSTVGVDRIIAECKIAKMTFYKCYPAKLLLIEDCLKIESKNIHSAINEKLLSCVEYDSLEKLKVIYEWHIELIKTKNYNGCLFHKASGTFLKEDYSIFEIIDQHKIGKINLIRTLLLDLNIVEPDSLAALIVNILDGMLINARYDQFAHLRGWHFLETCLNHNRVDLFA